MSMLQSLVRTFQMIIVFFLIARLLSLGKFYAAFLVQWAWTRTMMDMVDKLALWLYQHTMEFRGGGEIISRTEDL